MGPLFRSLTCGHRLCEAAAGRCIGALRDLIGGGGDVDKEEFFVVHASHLALPSRRLGKQGGVLPRPVPQSMPSCCLALLPINPRLATHAYCLIALLPCHTPPAGPNIFAGRLSDDQRQLMQSSPDVPPPAGLFGGPPGGSLVTPQLVLTGRP